jgi:carbon-monoxide dehydrogenase catalytic subunit
MGFRLLGLNSYHCITPPVSGSDKVSKFFFEDTKELLGSVMVVDPDPVALAKRIIADFDERRADLCWGRCAPPAADRLSLLQKEQEHDHAHQHGHSHIHDTTEDHHHAH